MKKFSICLFLIFFSGLIAGRLSGDYIRSAMVRGNITILSFMFSPSRGFVDMFSSLNSSDDFKRLSGYYAYRDSGMVDLDFLLERYKVEDASIIKKVIIWAAEGAGHKEKLVDFYRKIYDISTADIQKMLIVKIKENKK